jgi:hypothetical protein
VGAVQRLECAHVPRRGEGYVGNRLSR